jgi:hypothetical protein
MAVHLLIINVYGTRGIGYAEQKLCRPLIFEQQCAGCAPRNKWRFSRYNELENTRGTGSARTNGSRNGVYNIIYVHEVEVKKKTYFAELRSRFMEQEMVTKKKKNLRPNFIFC